MYRSLAFAKTLGFTFLAGRKDKPLDQTRRLVPNTPSHPRSPTRRARLLPWRGPRQLNRSPNVRGPSREGRPFNPEREWRPRVPRARWMNSRADMRIDGHSLAERPLPAVRHPASSRHGSDTGVPMIHLLGRITYHRLSTVDNEPEPGRRFDAAQAGPRGCCQPSSMQNGMSFVTSLACPQRLLSSKFLCAPQWVGSGAPTTA